MKRLPLLLIIFLPLLLHAGYLSITADLSGFDPAAAKPASGWGRISAPGYPQLPVKTVNVILPPEAVEVQFTYSFLGTRSSGATAPAVNPAFTDGEKVLTAPQSGSPNQSVVFLGTHRWGDIKYASFRVLPAINTESGWQWSESVQLNLSWDEGRAPGPNRLPSILRLAEKGGSFDPAEFFANPQALREQYSQDYVRNYDYLVVSTPQLYAAVSSLITYHQGQGLTCAFADIATILASSPGNTSGEKLRNFLISEYDAHPFSYLLLVGDHDTVPLITATPEPDGDETAITDFFFSDLSSVMDSDGDGRLGEYSPGEGIQDWLCDYTPEVYVGRISTNSATVASQIASRTVAYDQSSAPWKQNALLPAAYFNYQGEPDPLFLQTDGATLIEYAKDNVLTGHQCTTLYEQLGVVPSYPSDHDLDYNQIKTLLSANSYGILSWSAHGSATSSARKVWLEDYDEDNFPDPGEMTWLGMVDRQTFDGLANSDGLILFCASCYNGRLDYPYSSCLAEYALEKKAVNVLAATRTGWYKVGWANPGWGGLSSYNLHWLENIIRNQMSVGAATAWTNLLHTQYYLFGDPVDDGGIIWPELKNVYTNLLFGDPAVGHSGTQYPPQAEILIYEPTGNDGPAIADAINANGRFNVIYTDKVIPDYDYIDRFEAILCFFGFGQDTYYMQPDSLDYALLSSYLANGGRIYLEGNVGWDPYDPFWENFGTHAPLDCLAYVERVGCRYGGRDLIWDYDQTSPETDILVPYSASAMPLFSTANTTHTDHTIGIYNDNGTCRTIASSFSLGSIIDGDFLLDDILGVILDTLGVIDVEFAAPVEPQDIVISNAENDALLSWEPVIQNVLGQSITVDRYDVYFSQESPWSGFSLLGTTDVPEFTHAGAGNLSNRGFYKVRAVIE
ncbi:MAG: C25 family cysteine peptidase [Candidatus Syntrophosphaera sp.]